MGRPRLNNNDETVRVGFSVTATLWLRFIAVSQSRGVGYSELFREMLEDFLSRKDAG